MSAIRFEGVTKTFGDFEAVKELDLEIRRASSSRCSARRAAARPPRCAWSPVSSCRPGRIFLEGEPVETVPPYKRHVNTVFQSYALFAHLTSRKRRLRAQAAQGGQDEIRPRVVETLELVG